MPVSLPICRHAPRCRQRKRRATSGSSVGFGTSAGSFRHPGAGARLAESSVVKDWRRNWPAAVVHQGELGMYTRPCLVALAFTVAGCASMGGYQPTVAPYDDPYGGRLPHVEAECRQMAFQTSLGTAE